MPHSILLAFAFAAASPFAAAQTFVVDAQNGPGTDFTDLPTAVAAVPDGAVLLVLPGNYGPVELDGKGMSILAAGPGVTIVGGGTNAVSVVNLAANQTFTLRGVGVDWWFSSFPGGWAAGVYLQACAGPVLLQAVSCWHPWDGLGNGVFVDACTAVTVRECYLLAHRGLVAQDSQVAVEQSSMIGEDAWDSGFLLVFWGAGEGVAVEGGTVTLSRCQAQGGNDDFFGSPAPAMTLNGGELRLCEDSSGLYAAGEMSNPVGPPTQTPAIGGTTGVVVRAPGVALLGGNGGPAVGATLTDVVLPLPSLHTQSAGPGGTVIAEVTTPIGELVLLAIALPGPVLTVPGIDGSVWLDPATAVLVAAGVPQPGTPLQHSVSVPPTPALIAARFCWQALAWNANDGFRSSNPSTLAL